jgi:hypothetical protein
LTEQRRTKIRRGIVAAVAVAGEARTRTSCWYHHSTVANTVDDDDRSLLHTHCETKTTRAKNKETQDAIPNLVITATRTCNLFQCNSIAITSTCMECWCFVLH